MKLSIRKFSERINISISTISELEKGYNIPRFETILYIGLCLDICIEDILKAIRPIQLKADSEVLNQGADYNKILKLCLYELNSDGINMVDEFIKFIKSNPKYLSKSAYKRQMISLFK